MGNKKITVDPILGGAHACCAPPPLDPQLLPKEIQDNISVFQY